MSFLTPSLNTLGSFVFELCSRQTDRLVHPMILSMPTVGNNISYTAAKETMSLFG